MELHILLAGVEFGPYTDDKARQLLDEGFLSATDPAKRLDEVEWLSLSDVLAASPVAVAAGESGGSGGSTAMPAPEFRSLAAALEEEESVEEFHAPLPPGSEIAEAPTADEETGSVPESSPEITPVIQTPVPDAPKDRPPVAGLGGLTPPSVVAASRVTRAIAPRPSLEPLSSPPPTAPLPAARTTRRLARMAREEEPEPSVARPKSTPVASEEIKSSFAAALAKTRSMSGDTAPLPAPTRSGGKPAPIPAPKPVSEPITAEVAKSKAEPAPAVAPAPARASSPPGPTPVSRTSMIRAPSLTATGTAPLTALTLTSRAKRPTVTGSLLAKEALLKAREKNTGVLASRMITSTAPAADFRPEALAVPRKRTPVKLADREAPATEAPAATTVPTPRKSIRLTGRISLPGPAAAELPALETVPAPVEASAAVAAPAPVELPKITPVRVPAVPRATPVPLRENSEAELTSPKTSTSRKAIRLSGPISLPGRTTQPTRPAPLSPSLSDTGPLTTSFPKLSVRSRAAAPPAPVPTAPPAPAPAPEREAPSAAKPDAAAGTRLPDRPRMSLRSLIHPAETAAVTALAAEGVAAFETKTEPDASPADPPVSSGSLKITGPLRQPSPPRIPIRLSSPSGEGSIPAGLAETSTLADPKPSSPVPEEELLNRPASGKIPVHEFPPEGVRVRTTRRLTAKVPLPDAPHESITSESPARQSPPPLPAPEDTSVALTEPIATPEPVSAAPAPVKETPAEIPLVTAPSLETPSNLRVEPETPPVEPPAPAPLAKPEKVRLRKPVKLELTSRKVQESGKLSLEAFSKLTGTADPAAPISLASIADAAPDVETTRASGGEGFSSKPLEEAPSLTWTSARRATPFPLEWIFYGIVALGLVAGVPTAYLILHHPKATPAAATVNPTPAPNDTTESGTTPSSAAPPANASAPPSTTPPITAVVPAVPATNAAPAPAPPPTSPTQDVARQASAFVSDGSLKYQHGDFDGAINAFNQALTLDPKSTEAFFNRGIAKAAHDDLDGAVADYSQALDIDPNMAQAYYYRGLARHSKAELDGAISDYNNAVRIDPKNALAFFNRGLIRMQKDDIDGAIVDSTSALELDPKLIQSYYDRGLGRLAKGASDSALEDMKTFTQLAPQDGYTDYARLYIWLIQTQQGQLAEANKELNAAMNTSWNGRSDDMVTRIGEFLLGQISESDLIKASGSSMPSRDQGQRCEAWYFIGMRKLEAGDKDGGAEALRKCVDTQKTDYCEFILAQEELKKLMPGTVPEPATLPAPRAQAAALPDPGTMAPPDNSLPPIPH